ncbi:MAG: YicC/YloC family endoribonuclease [Bacteroidota bacterium]
MIESMTGYGAGFASSPNYKVTIELKSLNSKYLELVLKLPRVYIKYEHQIRNILTKGLKRGKVVVLLNVEVLSADKRTLMINRPLAKKYLEELTELGQWLNLDDKVNLPFLLQLPEIIPTEIEQEDPEEWDLVKEALSKAVVKLQETRAEEGKALEQDLSLRRANIQAELIEIKKLAPIRLDNVRSRVEQSLEDIRHKIGDLDQNRFEQELVFYLEKLDINEEVVRLQQHLDFFQEMQNQPKSNGKKLQFIAQEMGREINTIGSKANDASIQRRVVAMKDELEKIKEQVLNIV